jgi:hypothetical protein
MPNLLSTGTAFAGIFGPDAILSGTGTPVASTPVTVYQSDGSTVANLYTDQTHSVGAANPVSTDTLGNLVFYTWPGEYVLSFLVSGVPTTKVVEVNAWFSDTAWNVVVDTSSQTAVSGDLRLANATSGAIVETLPSPLLGVRALVVKTDSSVNTVTLSTPSGVILGPGLGAGASTFVLSGQGASATVFGDGTNFHVTSGSATGSGSPPYYFAYASAATSMVGGAWTEIALAGTEASGGSPLITLGSNKLTLPVAGVYHFEYGVNCASNGARSGLAHNGTTSAALVRQGTPQGSITGAVSVGSCDLVCAAADYVTLLGYNDGTTGNCGTGSGLTYLQARWACSA